MKAGNKGSFSLGMIVLVWLMLVSAPAWAMFVGGSGTSGDPWQIATPAQLNNVRNYLGITHADKYFVLTADIDLSDYSGVEGWEPIGTNGNEFTGTFDGGGQVIRNLVINRSVTNEIGLFGSTKGAVIKNVGLVDVDVKGKWNVGGLVGSEWQGDDGGSLTNVYVTGTVVGAGGQVGGLAGYYEGTIADAYSTADVEGTDYVGGLVGMHANHGQITNSHATGAVHGNDQVGGLVGEVYRLIRESYAIGPVVGSGDKVGGLVGHAYASIEASYATGSVAGVNEVGWLIGFLRGNDTAAISNIYATGTVSASSHYVGGLVGEATETTITNAYAVGMVSGTGSVGGLVGQSWKLDVITSYYNSETTGQSDTGMGDPRTTEEMKRQSTFSDWDFATIWAIREDIFYPHLQWQLASDFSGTPVSGPAPLTMQFADESTGDPTGWAWYFGDEDWAAGSWVEMTSSAGWTGRYNHTSVALPDGSIVLMGGQGDGDEGGHFRDVWRTIDQGETWVETTPAATWSARNSHASVALPDGSIVLMGGRNSGGYESDVWRSTDKGATWTEMTNSAGWAARAHHAAVALPDGSILLMGGYNDADYGTTLGDVWRSTDRGATWTEMTGAAEWPARNSATIVALHDGSILLLGGSNDSHQELNDVWRSTDQGETWAQVTPGAEWSVRYGTTGVALPDGSIVLVGGGNYGTNDVWRSTDLGESWTKLTDSAPWPPRGRHTSIALPDGSIVLMGGYAGPKFNDVWRLETAGSYEQSPSHTYTEPGVYSVALQSYKTNGTSSIARQDYLTVAGVSQFTVTPSAGAGGSISPSSPQLVIPGATASFTVTPEAGYTAQAGGTCGGNLAGSTFTTDIISADCTVEVSFVVVLAIQDGSGNPFSEEPVTQAVGESLDFQVVGAENPTLVLRRNGEEIAREGRLLERDNGHYELLFSGSGLYEVEVSAGGETRTLTIAVYPHLAFVSPRQAIPAAAQAAEVLVFLDGPAPYYPVTVPYNVSGAADLLPLALREGTLEIAAAGVNGSDGLTAGLTMEFTESPASSRELVFQLGEPENALIGRRASHTLLLEIQPLAPLVDLNLYQQVDSEVLQVAEVVQQERGLVEVRAQVSNLSSGALTFDWSASDYRLVNQAVAEDLLVFDPAALVPDHYLVELRVTEAVLGLSATATLVVKVLANCPDDSAADGCGVRDSGGQRIPDQSALPGGQAHRLLLAEAGQEVAETAAGLRLRPGRVARAANRTGLQVTLDEIAAHAGLGGSAAPQAVDYDYDNFGGYFDFEVAGLTAAGQIVTVVLPLAADIPSGAVYRKYNPERGWFTFVEDEFNRLWSAARLADAACPPLGSSLYGQGLVAGNDCLLLEIEEGGPNDFDRSPNGIASDPGGLALAGDATAPPPVDDPSVPTGSSSGCFIATAAYGSPLAPQVMVLRDFRDRYLLTNDAGRWLVDLYYHYSPPLAERLAQSETLRRLARWGLTPLVLAFQYPLITLLLLGLGVAGLVTLAGRNAWSGPAARRRLSDPCG